MIIAAYNLLKGGTRRVHWTKMIKDYGVDLLLVQESFSHKEHLSPSSKATCQVVWQKTNRNPWGSGLYSPTGSVKAVSVPGFAGWVVGARITRAAWQAKPTSPLFAFSVHIPAGTGGYYGQTEKLLDVIKKIVGKNDFVIGGDFNILVSQHPELGRPISKREIALQKRLDEEFHMINCWQSANPGKYPCQTLRWSGNRSIPYHCDGIFVPKSWKNRLLSCDVISGTEWNQLSDHNPVVARFK